MTVTSGLPEGKYLFAPAPFLKLSGKHKTGLMNRWKMAIYNESQINLHENRTHFEWPGRDMSIEGDADAVDDLPQVSNFALFIL